MENGDVEVELSKAKQEIGAGTHIFVWIGGRETTEVVAIILKTEEKNVIEVNPRSFMNQSFEADFQKMLGGRIPIMVCHHGVSSLQAANILNGWGIKSQSLEGGIEGARL